ncbi:hypothetical protein J7E62_32560 [Variovorax paradoxus]|nr:hypothetical protein [Variovorax paradoxus]
MRGWKHPPDQLRQLAAAFTQAAADCEARETRGKHVIDKEAEYPLAPSAA